MRAIQDLRKDADLEFSDRITLGIRGADDVIARSSGVRDERNACDVGGGGSPEGAGFKGSGNREAVGADITGKNIKRGTVGAVCDRALLSFSRNGAVIQGVNGLPGAKLPAIHSHLFSLPYWVRHICTKTK